MNNKNPFGSKLSCLVNLKLYLKYIDTDRNQSNFFGLMLKDIRSKKKYVKFHSQILIKRSIKIKIFNHEVKPNLLFLELRFYFCLSRKSPGR
ncbi:hypothetical protein OENI_50008 [Oenococcus oeni]|nr:hypothetical protein OENI_50008 [Oenococcus oeni]